MPLLKVVQPDEAQGVVKEIYDRVKADVGLIPKPLQMLSTSPNILGIHSQVIDYYFKSQQLSLPLLTHIRYLAANHYDYQHCIDFNASLLTMYFDLTEEDLETVLQDPGKAKLSDKDRAMLQFVAKAVTDPASTEQTEVDRLRELGWTDENIFDALFHGASMITAGVMFKALKMDLD